METLKKVLFFILFAVLFLIGGILIYLILNALINLIDSDDNVLIKVFGIIFVFTGFMVILKKIDDL
jgi:hypothetical protein